MYVATIIILSLHPYILIPVGEDSTNESSQSKVAVNCLSEISSVVKSSSTECRQQSILLQQSSSVTIVSDTHTTSSSSLLSKLECVTISNSVVISSIGGPTLTAAAGEWVLMILIQLDRPFI